MFETLLQDWQLSHDGHTARALRDRVRDPHTLPEADPARRTSRQVSARIRRIEDAWARHADDANGFGCGGSITWRDAP